jgi:polar amino acid transport system ATP-binding protein
MVTVNNLSIDLDDKVILADIHCSLEPGRIVSFIGRSGAGKTTLLKSLVGLVAVSKGSIFLDDQKELRTFSDQQRAKKIGYVFQDFNLFSHMTVLQNCIDPLIVYGISESDARNRAIEVLKQLGMNDFVKYYPLQLSGGQKQRVAIARALCLNPSILLLDEPTASLDPINTDTLIAILQSLADQGLTIGISSQDMGFVRKIFDKVYYLESGKIIEICDTNQSLSQCPLIQNFIKM